MSAKNEPTKAFRQLVLLLNIRHKKTKRNLKMNFLSFGKLLLQIGLDYFITPNSFPTLVKAAMALSK